MRKNAVDKNVYPIIGGICAPEGFSAGAVSCGLKDPTQQCEDLALIMAEHPCPTAAVFTDNHVKGAPILLSKKHLKNGEAKAILVNSGIALACNENAEQIAKKLCSYLSESFVVYPTQVILASTGSLQGKIDESLLRKGIKQLPKALSREETASISVAKAITTTDVNEKQGAFTFMLGDYPIKIGYVAKGNVCVCPNMATTLCFLTTDVNISSKMLQKALSSQMKDTVNMINVDGTSSMNDTVYLMSSCRAGNAKIITEDTDFEKFEFALKQVLTSVSEQIVSDAGALQMLKCVVEGAKSKQVARSLAKSFVGCIPLKKAVAEKCIDITQLINAMGGVESGFNVSQLDFRICGKNKKLLLFDKGRAIAYSQPTALEILQEPVITVCIRLQDGNYCAQAWGNVVR